MLLLPAATAAAAAAAAAAAELLVVLLGLPLPVKLAAVTEGDAAVNVGC